MKNYWDENTYEVERYGIRDYILNFYTLERLKEDYQLNFYSLEELKKHETEGTHSFFKNLKSAKDLMKIIGDEVEAISPRKSVEQRYEHEIRNIHDSEREKYIALFQVEDAIKKNIKKIHNSLNEVIKKNLDCEGLIELVDVYYRSHWDDKFPDCNYKAHKSLEDFITGNYAGKEIIGAVLLGSDEYCYNDDDEHPQRIYEHYKEDIDKICKNAAESISKHGYKNPTLREMVNYSIHETTKAIYNKNKDIIIKNVDKTLNEAKALTKTSTREMI